MTKRDPAELGLRLMCHLPTVAPPLEGLLSGVAPSHSEGLKDVSLFMAGHNVIVRIFVEHFSCEPTGGTAPLPMHKFVLKKCMETGSACIVWRGSPPLSCAEDLYLCSASVRSLDKKGFSVMDKDEQ